MKVIFIYSGSKFLPEHEKVATNLCLYASKVIPLPNQIEIEFTTLSNSTYGVSILTHKFQNRFKINESLSVKEIIYPIVHELIHVSQIHTNRLKLLRDGTCVWDKAQYRVIDPNTLSYTDYSNLPWEVDVNNRLETVVFSILSEVDK